MDDDVLSEKRMLLETAFPGQVFDDEQVEAMAEFVYLCAKGDKDDKDDYKEKKAPELDIVFAEMPSAKGKKK